MSHGGVNRYLQLIKQGGAILSIFAFILMPWAIPVSQGASLDSLRQKQEAAARKAAEYRRLASQKQGTVQTLSQAVASLNAQINELQARIAYNQARINDTQANINETEKEIRKKEAILAENQRKQAEALQTLYIVGQESTLESLISSSSLSEVVARDQYLSALEEKIESMMRAIKLLKRQLEIKRDNLKKHQQELVNLRKQLTIQKQSIQKQQAQKQRLLTNAATEMNRLKAQAAAQEAFEEKIEAQIRAQFASVVNRHVKGTGVKVYKGDIIGYEGSTGFSTGCHVHWEVNVGSITNHKNPRNYVPNPFRWPLDDFVVTQEFGMTSYARSGAYGGKPHMGIDISGPCGEPVRAAGNGEIILNQYYGGYGNAVIIDHGTIYTLYGHMTGK